MDFCKCCKYHETVQKTSHIGYIHKDPKINNLAYKWFQDMNE